MIRWILILSLVIAYIDIAIFSHLVRITFSYKRSITTSSRLSIFISIRRFTLRLFTIYISRVNLIIIGFSFEVLSFIKKERVIYLLVKYRFKLISRKVIGVIYFLIEKEGTSLFKKTRSSILIGYSVSRYSNFDKAFKKRLNSSIR